MNQTVERASIERTTARAAASTEAFYRENAQSYFHRTFELQMDHLYRPFLEAVGDGRRLLDVGCGSGRDVKAFRVLGYDAFGIDPSPDLVALATAHAGPYFSVARAETYKAHDRFDGVWACASLLHLRRADLHSTMRNLRALLKQGGVLFASVQLGAGDCAQPDGRWYIYYSAAEFKDATTESGLMVLRSWETNDVLRNDGPTWINILARREH